VNRKRRAVLSPADDLAADADDLSDPGAAIIGQVGVVLRPVRLGHQNLYIVPDKLIGAISEQPLGRGIDVFDQAFFIDGDDGDDGRFEDASELGSLSLRRRRVARALRHDVLRAGWTLALDSVSRNVRK